MSYIVYWYQPSETAYELYSHMGKQIYWGSYTIAISNLQNISEKNTFAKNIYQKIILAK